MWEIWVWSLGWEIAWRRKQRSPPVFWPGEYHGLYRTGVTKSHSCVVGRGCLLWPVRSLGTILWAFALLHSVLQGLICLLLQLFLDFLLLHSSPLEWKGHLIWVCVLKDLIGLHRTIQHQLLQCYWLEHRLGLLWYWMVCLGNEQRSFCHFWDCIQVLHFRLFCWPWWLLHFF